MKKQVERKLKQRGHSDPSHALIKLDESKNINALTKMNAQLYAIMQEYGSNTQEHDHLGTAYDRIFDAIEIIKEKDAKGEYTELGRYVPSWQLESSVEQQSMVATNVNTVIDYLANGFEELALAAKKVKQAQKEADRGNYDKVARLISEVKRDLRGGNQLSQPVKQHFDQVTQDLHDRMTKRGLPGLL